MIKKFFGTCRPLIRSPLMRENKNVHKKMLTVSVSHRTPLSKTYWIRRSSDLQDLCYHNSYNCYCCYYFTNFKFDNNRNRVV